MNKKFFLDQHGCAKNQVDGELLISNLIEAGWQEADSAEAADLILINSCGFIESAKKESLDALLGARKKFPEKKIILAGCLAQRYAKIFSAELPEADGFFGNGDLGRIAEFADKIARTKSRAKKPAALLPPQEGVSCGARRKMLSYKNSAYVKITEGCSNHCSFCAIPLIRGELRSRPIDDIVSEIKGLLKQGVFEINLIGQDLAAYGTGAADFFLKPEQDKKGRVQKAGAGNDSADKADNANTSNAIHSPLYTLLKKISSLKGKFWIRLLYIHPDHFKSDILELIQKDSRILPYFDIPFQSGDDDIIRAMNRKNTAEYYKALVREIRAAAPEAAVRTTFLTGFPGETDGAAENTLKFLQEIQSDWSGCFPYSKEEDTAAFKMKKQVAKKTAKERAAVLQAEQEKITAVRLKMRVGKEYDVLIEELLDGFAIGRAWFQAPEVDGNFVVQLDSDEGKKAESVQAGALVRVKALAVSGVDIDSVLV